jgi:hypothetical protein
MAFNANRHGKKFCTTINRDLEGSFPPLPGSVQGSEMEATEPIDMEDSTDDEQVTNATRSADGPSDLGVPLNISSDTKPFVTIVVGPSGTLPPDVHPHYVVIGNEAANDRLIGIEIRDRDARVAAVDTTLQFPQGGLAKVTFATPSTYEVSLLVDDNRTTIDVPHSFFDCNDSATKVSVNSDGSIEDRTVSTMVACMTTAE